MSTPNLIEKLFGIAVGVLTGASFAHADPWPELPKTAFLAGRTATPADVNEGRAIFVLAVSGTPIGVPIAIEIPQFALMDGGASKPPIPVVVVQAEAFPKGKLVGVRDVRGKEYVAKLSDLKLLGTSKPQEAKP